MAYERVNWENLPSTKTPINQTNLNKMENGIDQAGAEIFVGAEEPTAGEKVWFNKDKNSIYVRNSNGVYEEFIKKDKIIKSDYSNLSIPSSSSPFHIGNPVVINRKGTIMFTTTISFSVNGSGYRQAGTALNGATDVQTALIGATNTASMTIQSVGILDVNQGDTIQMIAKQNSGSDLTLWARLRIKYI